MLQKASFIVHRRLASAALVSLALFVGATAHAQVTGPASTQSPYMVPSVLNVTTQSLLTVSDDSAQKPALSGTPTGLAITARTDDTFTLAVGHDDSVSPTPQGLLSSWVFEKKSFRLRTGAASTASLKIKTRSGNPSPFFSPLGSVTPVGDSLPVAMSVAGATRPNLIIGEAGVDGRAFAVWQTAERNEAIELPALGRTPHFSLCLNPDRTTKYTFALWLNPQNPGQIYAYLGDKPETGTELQTLGLDKGKIFGVAIDGIEAEDRSRAIGEGVNIRKFLLVRLGDGATLSGKDIDKKSEDFGISKFLTPAAGAWDPVHPNDFFFVTTDQFDDLKEGADTGQIGRTRLWRLSFQDHAFPLQGGTLCLLLDGIGKYQCFSSLAIDTKGRILLGESPGNKARGARLWAYTIADKSLAPVAELDIERFNDPKPPFTRRVDTTALLDASSTLGDGWWLVALRAVRDQGPSGGQIMAVYVPR